MQTAEQNSCTSLGFLKHEALFPTLTFQNVTLLGVECVKGAPCEQEDLWKGRRGYS